MNNYDHIKTVVQRVAEGARRSRTYRSQLKTMDPEVFKAAYGKVDQEAPFASRAELSDYDAIIFDTLTRLSNVSGQICNLLDHPGGLRTYWMIK
ncbi:flavoprotein WrbA domain protein [Pseudomonas synxantha BG33R]|nr:flavoprotein WrbA domain protein [Pseudomonas synxantha BG33R]